LCPVFCLFQASKPSPLSSAGSESQRADAEFTAPSNHQDLQFQHSIFLIFHYSIEKPLTRLFFAMNDHQSLRTFDGAVAIITGGASGIGRALGETLSMRGAKVVLADRQFDIARNIAAGIRDRGGQANAEELDVTDFRGVNRLVESTFQNLGRLDYIFNNAGIGIVGEARLYELEDWYRVLDVNLRGVIHGVQAAYPIMLRQGFGHIVNTASFAGLFPYPLFVGYCATKHAVVGLSTALRIEAAAAGVRVSVLCPGPVRTQALIDGGKFGKILQPIPLDALKRMVDRQHPMLPEQFANQALRAVRRNRAIIVIPSRWQLLWWLYRFSPSLGLYFGSKGLKFAKRMIERSMPKNS
jgi:NAD(P)-dependent dehydrogenase (short-subunit alcohol dehydrogenase family)